MSIVLIQKIMRRIKSWDNIDETNSGINIGNIIDVNINERVLSKDKSAKLLKCQQEENPSFQYNYDIFNIQEHNPDDCIDNDTFKEEIYNWGLTNRKSNQKLSYEQIWYVRQEANKSEWTTKQLSNKFSLSVSQINKIKRMNDEDIIRGRSKSIIKLNASQTNLLRKTINDFIVNTDYAFIAEDVASFVNQTLNKNYPIYFIRSFMRN